jgi:hypothetical protein
MSARTPRRTFAHPFVVTLAAVPACTSPRPPHQNPPPPPTPTEPASPDTAQTPPTAPTAPTTPDPASPPPAPAPGAPAQGKAKPPDYTQRWYVTKNGATCLATPHLECPTAPPGQPAPTCNPPPPSAYRCPDGVTDASFTVVRYANTVQCVIQPPPPKCPPNAACNPPRPRPVECPKP